MTTIQIHYTLNEIGRKADLLAGGTGKGDRLVEVPVTPELLAIAAVDHEGRATYDLQKRRGCVSSTHDYPAVMSPEQAAAEALRVEAELRAKEAEREAERKREAEERRAREEAEAKAKRERVARVVALLHEIPAEHWVFGKYPETVTPNPGPDYVTAGIGELPDPDRKAAWEEYGRREKAAEAAKAEAEAKAIAERDEWIRAHGSPRLKKALAAGMVDKMSGAYLDERIAHDLGDGWANWQTTPEPKANDRLNSEESELDELAAARAKWPDCDVRLRSVGGTDGDGEEHDWRPALLMDCPWAKDETAIKYLD